MKQRVMGVVLAAATVGLGAVNCAAPPMEEETDPVATPAAAGDGTTDDVEPAALVPTDHCVAEIERPIPADLVLPIGTQITLKTGGAICPLNLSEPLAYRYYVEKVDSNGNIIATRVSPQGPTEWSFTRSSFDTSNLPGAGRYRIYGFSLPRTLIPAWQQNDSTVRATARRTGNAYTRFVTTSWQTGAFGSCSASCGAGTSSRSVDCKDSDGVTRPDSWCSGAKPSASQACTGSDCGCFDPMCDIFCMPHCMIMCPGSC